MKRILYRELYRIRKVEERISEIYPSDKIKSPVHLSIGQEFISVGVCLALKPKDVVFGTYRSHAMYLAKGGDLKAMVAELYGKSTGCCKGKGGSMHLADREHGIMGTSAVVGTTIPNAVGYAYAMKLSGKDALTVCFLGDGATEEGVFYESINFAVLHNLPIKFVCENNNYAIHTRQIVRQAEHVLGRVRGFGIDIVTVHDGDIFSVYNVFKDLRTPGFLEVCAGRWKEHVGPGDDFYLGYRSMEEIDIWKEKDPLANLRNGISNVKEIEDAVDAEINEAFVFAENSPFPDEIELLEDVYA